MSFKNNLKLARLVGFSHNFLNVAKSILYNALPKSHTEYAIPSIKRPCHSI
jgi:hypothetical protein